jgi:hypothetical protein
MIAPEHIIARLAEQLKPTTLVAVDGAGAMSAAFDQMNFSRRAFVVPGQEEAAPNTTGTISLVQRVRAGFTVFVGFAVTDAIGARALDDAFAVREAIKTVLVGWLPDSEQDSSPMEYAGSAVADIDPAAAFLVYAVNFSTTYYVRA